MKKKLHHRTLAEGEVTGHFHQASAGDVYEQGDHLLLDAPEGAGVTHQEHGRITLPPGQYERHLVREYDPFEEEIRNVVD